MARLMCVNSNFSQYLTTNWDGVFLQPKLAYNGLFMRGTES